MKKEEFKLTNHPKYGRRKADLNPFQKGLIKETKKYLEKKELGEKFEKKLIKLLSNAFPDDVVIWNIIFESGNYIDSLKLYESLQMDILVVTSVGVFCIEAKWINNDKYSRLSGGALSKSWTLKTKRGTTNSEMNGLKQNYRHKQFLDEIFEKENVVCPVYQVTVIGDLERRKIAVQQFIDANLIDTDELIDRISYIKNRNKSVHIDINCVVNILKDWECNVEGADILHVVYARNIAKKRLPLRCKKEMRHI